MAKRCREYVGVACVDGSCPKANREEYEERDIHGVKNCSQCFYYKGCEDCALKDTKYCVGENVSGKMSMLENFGSNTNR